MHFEIGAVHDLPNQFYNTWHQTISSEICDPINKETREITFDEQVFKNQYDQQKQPNNSINLQSEAFCKKFGISTTIFESKGGNVKRNFSDAFKAQEQNVETTDEADFKV